MNMMLEEMANFSVKKDVLDEQELVKLAAAVGQGMGLTWVEITQLEQVAFLHDVEPDMLQTSDTLGHLVEAVGALGWRWDGFGNPSGTAGDDLPLSSRIVTVCYTYLSLEGEALPGVGEAFALSALRAGAGSRFCPRSVGALIGVVDPLVRAPKSLVA